MSNQLRLEVESFVREVERRKELAETIESAAQGGQLPLNQLSLVKGIIDKDAVVAAGSFCETYTCSVLTECFRTLNEGAFHFVSKQAIEQKFFRLFNFGSQNANQFFGMFGSSTKDALMESVRAREVGESVQAFLQLCKARNALVHNNYATADTDFTIQDTLTTVVVAVPFFEWLASDFVELLIAPVQGQPERSGC
jgi:hypothetical protein